MRCLVTALSLLAVLGLGQAGARAQEAANEQLESIRGLVFDARFSDAVDAARAFLNREDLSATARNAGLEVLAIAQLADRQGADATQTLQLLYSRDPGHRLTDPDASPPVISAFARARESHPPLVPVTLEHEPPTLTDRRSPLIRLTIPEGSDAVAEVRLSYQMAGETPARVVMTHQPDGSYTARLPLVGDPSRPVDVAYQIVALAPSLTPLAHLGTVDEPLHLRIPPAAREPSPSPEPLASATSTPTPSPPAAPAVQGGSVLTSWWFWTLIAVVVIGGAVTAGILLGPAQKGPEQGTLGSVRLMSVELP